MCIKEVIISLLWCVKKYAEDGVTSYDIGTGFGHFAIATQDVGEANFFMVFLYLKIDVKIVNMNFSL